MNYKKEIVNRINKIAGKYSAYEVFSDWIKMSSLTFSNNSTMVHDSGWKKREQEYLNTLGRYEKRENVLFAEMLGLLTLALEEKIEDVLGQIYMDVGMGSKAAGQFFTPYHLSKLCATLVIPEPDKDGKIYINEPSCGGGGMVIASIAALKEKGFDYQRNLEIVAQDLDWKGVYMCYLQLTLLGAKAICVQGDTLMEPYNNEYPKERILITPTKRGVFL